MSEYGLFYQDEQLLSTDLQAAFSNLGASIDSLVNRLIFTSPFVIINGLAGSQSSSADNGIQIASGVAFQNGQPVVLSTQQGVNVLPGSYPNGTGLAADTTYSRIDVVYIEYAAGQTNQQSRSFEPPGGSPYTQDVFTQSSDSYTLSVVHGTPASSPTAPAVPAGSVGILQVTVPANATAIVTADLLDLTATYRTDGGRLALATAGLLTFVGATTLGTPSGFTLQVGASDYIKDNTYTHMLDILGGSNGINLLSTVLFSLSGTPMVFQPTADATSGTHVISLKNSSGVEYASVDNTGKFTGSFSGNGSALTSLPTNTVALSNNAEITSAGSAQRIFSYTPTANGMATLLLYLRATASTPNVTATISYTDSGGSTSYTPNALNNQTVATGPQDVIAFSFECVAGSAITLNITAGAANQLFATSRLILR